jgi:membrane protein YdbS with pleckstrin-like domain
MFFTRPWGGFAGLIAAPILIQWSRKKSRSMRYCREADKIVYRSGVLNKITSTTFFDKVQTASFHQSPFDRKWRHASLVIDTAGAGPAEHVVSIRFLDEAFARQEYENISAITALTRPDFG